MSPAAFNTTPTPVRPRVCGVSLDPSTRCAHFHSALDVIAIRMHCCGEYYACKECHDELGGHPLEPWPHAERDARAVLCGACGIELSIREYLQCANTCPACSAPFNPRCASHYHFYFAEV